ncbi:MAG: hypothetical protein H6R06_4488, partial [Proteobacteria bacterium]|nr:hypothetical protein [Pseudomonadota bacterium]
MSRTNRRITHPPVNLLFFMSV